MLSDGLAWFHIDFLKVSHAVPHEDSGGDANSLQRGGGSASFQTLPDRLGRPNHKTVRGFWGVQNINPEVSACQVMHLGADNVVERVSLSCKTLSTCFALDSLCSQLRASPLNHVKASCNIPDLQHDLHCFPHTMSGNDAHENRI